MKKILIFVFLVNLFGACDKDQGTTTQNESPKKLKVVYKDKFIDNPSNVSIIFKVNDSDNYPLSGLLTDNFEIYENNELISDYEAGRKIQNKPEKFQFNVLLLLDLSGSVLDSSLSSLKEASIGLINAVMPLENESNYLKFTMAIKWFDGKEKLHNLVSYTNDVDVLINSINSIDVDISVDNSANLNGAIIQGIADVEERVIDFEQVGVIAAGAIITFTDGTDLAGWYTNSQTIDTIKNSNSSIALYSIGLGEEIDQAKLKEFGKNGFEYAENLLELIPRFEDIAESVKDEANSYYLLEYCSPKRAGTNELTIKVIDNDINGELSETFNADGFTGGCNLY